ncbi:MAG: hypothetical protein GEU74_11205 [Nitriliruptorales bacterium]|nr:hypothetical protein [Nitriliruptorales bacterium]
MFGPGTERATITFQKSAGLGPNGLGLVGSKTRKALRLALKAKSQPAPSTPAPTPKPSSPPATASGAPTLRIGDGGKPVKVWQRRLNRSRRVARIVVDGQFGPRTHLATVTFQKSVGLGPQGLGVVGPKTRGAMKRVLRRL